MSPAEHGEKDSTVVRVFRTQPARITGWALMAAALVLTGLTLRADLAAGRGIVGTIAVFALAASAVWVVLLRPCVRLRTDGVELRNLLSNTDVPFAALREVGHRWALELTDTAGRTHSSWAIPVKRQLRPSPREDSFAEATSASRGGREGIHALVVAGQVEREMQRWRLRGGQRGPRERIEVGTGTGNHESTSGAPVATRRWARDAVLPLAVSTLAVLVLVVGD